MKNPHTELKRESLLALSASKAGVFWANETGVALAGKWTGEGWKLEQPIRPIKFGLLGSSDLFGILNGGFFFAGEIKTGKGKQTPQQKKFENMVTDRGGLYIVIRDVETAVTDVLYFLKTIKEKNK